MDALDASSCPNDEMLAPFVEGGLDEAAAAYVGRHLSRCSSCRLVVEHAATIQEEIEGSSSWWKTAVIAACVAMAVIAGAFIVRQWRRPAPSDPIRLMASAAPASARSIEPRLTGGYRWTPFRNVMAEARNPMPDELISASVAANVIRHTGSDSSADGLHARGVAFLLRDDPAAGTSLLRQSARLALNDARIWNDLAAGLYVKAQSDADWREALDAARRAIRLDPNLKEARFNTALILDRFGTKGEALAAWNDYLHLDASGQWSDEARDRLAHDQEGR